MSDLKKKIEKKLEELKDGADDALEKARDFMTPDEPPLPTSTPFVGDVHYRGKPLFPGESILLNRISKLEDGEVTYMHMGKKKFTTRELWNLSVDNEKFKIK